MKRYNRIIALVVAFAFMFATGCATFEQMTGAEKGALGGAAVGAIAGGLLGSKGAKTEMAVLGGLIGAGVGWVAGKYYDKVVADRKEAAQKYAYSGKKTMVEIEKTAVNPTAVTPGSEIEAYTQYTVLTPSANQTVNVQEKRILVIDGNEFPLDDRTVNREQGTHYTGAKLKIPETVDDDFGIKSTVAANGVKKYNVINVPVERTAKHLFKVENSVAMVTE